MNSVSRTMATIAGDPVDRRVVIPVLSLYGARLSGCATARYFSDPAAYARGQAAVEEMIQPDVLLGPMAMALLGEAFGSELKEFPDAPPVVRRPAIGSAHEWAGVTIPDPATQPRLRYLVESVRLMAAQTQGRRPITIILTAPTDLAALIMGMDAWMEAILFEPETAHAVLRDTIPFFVTLANLLFEAGVAFLVLPCGLASPLVASREMVTAFTRPALTQAFAQLRGPVVVHHVGGPLLPNLDLLTGMPATAGFAVDSTDDLSRSRAVAGPEPVLFSGPQGPALPGMSRDGVERECRRILEDRRRDRRFVLVSAGADIPWNTPLENIQALRETAQEYGGWEA